MCESSLLLLPVRRRGRLSHVDAIQEGEFAWDWHSRGVWSPLRALLTKSEFGLVGGEAPIQTKILFYVLVYHILNKPLKPFFGAIRALQYNSRLFFSLCRLILFSFFSASSLPKLEIPLWIVPAHLVRFSAQQRNKGNQIESDRPWPVMSAILCQERLRKFSSTDIT
jgi:hypothetical protein